MWILVMTLVFSQGYSVDTVTVRDLYKKETCEAIASTYKDNPHVKIIYTCVQN